MAEFRTIIKHGYEEVALWRDQGAGIEAICAIHSTASGTGDRRDSLAAVRRP